MRATYRLDSTPPNQLEHAADTLRRAATKTLTRQALRNGYGTLLDTLFDTLRDILFRAATKPLAQPTCPMIVPLTLAHLPFSLYLATYDASDAASLAKCLQL